ncbi:glycosyltransferase [Desulfosporosinus sp. BG]|uniref:glycosyltransferase family 2 protein n=1 Tax=Desulfosporosinus sp. BG TaxID=1633135 RepID=UPI00083AD4D9|nr:glycosyltransferase [Desulfosporosinus sp. BG]
MRIITFAIPCYNSAAYIERCIDSLLPCGNDAEVIIVNDGSTDETGKIADKYAVRYPDIIRVIHQENGGHGEAVNAGLKNASGLYFKVVDSDDWIDGPGMIQVLKTLKTLVSANSAPDMMVCNYVYEKLQEGTRHVINYNNVFPCNKIFFWDEMRKFPPWKYLLMHSLIYKTQLLHKCGLVLPKHTFYVDNIFAYQPLPFVKTIYYLDVDLYHYFIGREDQSVNESVMLKRIDQQLLVTRILIGCHNLPGSISSKKLSSYMLSHLAIMMTICTVFLRISGTKEDNEKEKELWAFLISSDNGLYRHAISRFLRMVANLPGNSGNKITIGLYNIARKVYKFN